MMAFYFPFFFLYRGEQQQSDGHQGSRGQGSEVREKAIGKNEEEEAERVQFQNVQSY